jgi:hypothetical protein
LSDAVFLKINLEKKKDNSSLNLNIYLKKKIHSLFLNTFCILITEN